MSSTSRLCSGWSRARRRARRCGPQRHGATRSGPARPVDNGLRLPLAASGSVRRVRPGRVHRLQTGDVPGHRRKARHVVRSRQRRCCCARVPHRLELTLRVTPFARAVAAVATGAALILAFPPYDLWFVAIVVPAAFVLLVRDQPMRRSAAIGLLVGMGFFVPFLPWIGEEVGPVPWLILALVQALFFVPLGMVLGVVQRLPGWPVWTAAAWVAEEALRGRVPYGGFTWGKLAFSQSDGPLLGLAGLGGSPLLTFALALAGGLLAWAVLPGPIVGRLVAVAAAVGIVVAGTVIPTAAVHGEAVTVAVIQGNVPELSLDFNDERRVITRNNAAMTDRLADQVAAGEVPQPDIVVWPENSADLNPYADPVTSADISAAVAAVGVPTLVGALVPTPDERNVQNTSIVWLPDSGPADTYVKRHPMPFGEYIPFRRVARLITPAVDRQPRDFVAGQEIGVLEMGATDVGAVICFEVAFDSIVRDAVRGGGELLAVQTNNATFGFSPMTEQMLAMSRLRAVEHGRGVLVSALAGVSAIIEPDGSVVDRAELGTQDALVAEVPVATGHTVATTIGEWPEWVLVATTVSAIIAAALLSRRRPVDDEPTAAPAATVEAR
jgi:apolipoprotein N-acyltransferase